MNVLWAPWRMEYIESSTPRRCIFCVGSDGPTDDLVLVLDENAIVMLNRFPYNNGHVLIAPRRHVARLGELTVEEYVHLMATVRQSVAILERELRPEGMNVGINLGATAGAGIADHLHWHAVPRWGGDTNYMPVIGEVKVLPQHLTDSRDRLRPHFQALRSGPAG